MGSITKQTKVDKTTGKTVTVFRAYVRRRGFASKSKVCRTQREAKEWLRENEAPSALRRKSAGQRFTDLLDTFILSPKGKGQRYAEASHLSFWRAELGEIRVGDITRADINAAKARLLVRRARRSTPGGAIETDQPLSPATVNRYLASLSSVFNFALEHGAIDAHPMRAGAVRKMAEGNGRRRILTADEEGRLMAAARNSSWPMLPLFLRMCFTTAARRSEVLNLRWDQVDFENRIALLPKTKNGEPRALPLVDDVVESLKAAHKVKALQGGFVFFDPRKPAQPKNIDSVWRECREEAGLLNDREDPLDRVVLHSTRHTGVTRLLRAGANLAQAAAVSGHKTLAMLQRYQHLNAGDAVELARRHLAGAPAEPGSDATETRTKPAGGAA